MTEKHFLALCTQLKGQVRVRKFSWDGAKWFNVPKKNWPLEQHPEVEAKIQKLDELRQTENGRRTAKVPVYSGRNKVPTKAAGLYT